MPLIPWVEAGNPTPRPGSQPDFAARVLPRNFGCPELESNQPLPGFNRALSPEQLPGRTRGENPRKVFFSSRESESFWLGLARLGRCWHDLFVSKWWYFRHACQCEANEFTYPFERCLHLVCIALFCRMADAAVVWETLYPNTWSTGV